jgi:hypothetical protein
LRKPAELDMNDLGNAADDFLGLLIQDRRGRPGAPDPQHGQHQGLRDHDPGDGHYAHYAHNAHYAREGEQAISLGHDPSRA